MMLRIRAMAERKESGITMENVLVTMVIVVVLSAIGIPIFLNQRAKAHDTAVRSDITNAALAADTYYIDALNYPTAPEGFSNDGGERPLASADTSYVAFVGAQNYVIYGKSKSGALFRYDRAGGEGPIKIGEGPLPDVPQSEDTAAGLTPSAVEVYWTPTTSGTR